MKNLSELFKAEYDRNIFLVNFNHLLLSEEHLEFYLGFSDVEYELHSWVIEKILNEKLE